MKLKASLMFGVLILMLSVAGISPANAATAPVVNAPAAAVTPVLASESSSSFLCSLSQSVDVALPETDSLIPPSKPATTLPPPCSVCSDFACRTRSVGAVCGEMGMKVLHCYDFGTCPTDGFLTCRCVANIP